jgi:hypothetical protein
MGGGGGGGVGIGRFIFCRCGTTDWIQFHADFTELLTVFGAW